MLELHKILKEVCCLCHRSENFVARTDWLHSQPQFRVRGKSLPDIRILGFAVMRCFQVDPDNCPDGS